MNKCLECIVRENTRTKDMTVISDTDLIKCINESFNHRLCPICAQSAIQVEYGSGMTCNRCRLRFVVTERGITVVKTSSHMYAPCLTDAGYGYSIGGN